MRPFILVILGVILGSNLVAGLALDSILFQLAAGPALRWTMGGFLLLQILGLAGVIGGRVLGHQPGSGMGRPLLSLFMIWNLLLAPPTAVIATVAALLLHAIAAWQGSLHLSATAREAGILAAFAPAAISLLATAVALGQLGTFRIRRLELTIPDLPAALQGLTIAHLSDLHIGKLTRGRVLNDMIAATNALNADLALVTGDIINMALEDLPRAVEVLRAVKSRYGLFLCEGNHDLIESAASFESALRASGLRLLLNESASVSVRGQPVRIIGLRWGESLHDTESVAEPNAALARLLASGPADAFSILLVHHPEAFDAAVAAGIPLTLAGHTHGGQLMLTDKIGFGPRLYRYWSGWYQKGRSQLVVSNGAGNWFPLRVNAPAEIIHITVR